MNASTMRSALSPMSIHSSSRSTTRQRVSSRPMRVNVTATSNAAVSTGFKLGELELPTPLGIGCWSWGNTSFWNDSWTDADDKAAREAYRAAMANNIVFFDTAEAYNGPENSGSMGGISQGTASSERMLGEMVRSELPDSSTRPLICTKFAALPWRVGRGAVVDAMKASLDRLGMDSVDAYMIHWPGVWQNDAYAEGLGDVVDMGLVKCVGVSNHNVKQMRNAHDILARRGIKLSFNQMQYSLSYNNAENNGMLDAIKELDMVLMAYSPLQSGLLTGKYSSTNLPSGPRGNLYAPILQHIDPLLDNMRAIGIAHGDKTLTQVALNYLICQGNVLPIPGAKSAQQAQEFAGALGWSLTADEIASLRRNVAQMRKSLGDSSWSTKMVSDMLFNAQV